jgi:predicted aspartyl protease
MNPFISILILSIVSLNCFPKTAWDLWEKGDIQGTKVEALKLLKASPDEANHLLSLVSFVQGKFDKTIDYQEKVSSSYSEYKSTVMPVVDAYRHLDLYQSAYQFAQKNHDFSPELLSALAEMKNNQPKFVLKRTTKIPFKKSDFLNGYLPAFDMKINGLAVTSHLDTGGPFLVISTKLADKIGATYTYLSEGNCNNRKAKVWFAQTKIQLGDIEGINIPTMVSDCINGSVVEDRVIFGTNLLQRFLSTIDYPQSRLVISPFHLRTQHESLVSKVYSEEYSQQFYIWGDHYMFAKGQIGGRQNLNFFVDTGLVQFHTDGRQAAFFTTTDNLITWGYDEGELESDKVLNIRGSLGFASLVQNSHAVVHQEKVSFDNFGGIKISGLIGHAFIKNYSWTIDFENMTYKFLK